MNKNAALLRSTDAELRRAYFALAVLAKYGQEWIRTTEGVKPADLQSAPFGHFGTYPEDRPRVHGCPLENGPTT